MIGKGGYSEAQIHAITEMLEASEVTDTDVRCYEANVRRTEAAETRARAQETAAVETGMVSVISSESDFGGAASTELK